MSKNIIVKPLDGAVQSYHDANGFLIEIKEVSEIITPKNSSLNSNDLANGDTTIDFSPLGDISDVGLSSPNRDLSRYHLDAGKLNLGLGDDFSEGLKHLNLPQPIDGFQKFGMPTAQGIWDREDAVPHQNFDFRVKQPDRPLNLSGSHIIAFDEFYGEAYQNLHNLGNEALNVQGVLSPDRDPFHGGVKKFEDGTSQLIAQGAFTNAFRGGGYWFSTIDQNLLYNNYSMDDLESLNEQVKSLISLSYLGVKINDGQNLFETYPYLGLVMGYEIPVTITVAFSNVVHQFKSHGYALSGYYKLPATDQIKLGQRIPDGMITPDIKNDNSTRPQFYVDVMNSQFFKDLNINNNNNYDNSFFQNYGTINVTVDNFNANYQSKEYVVIEHPQVGAAYSNLKMVDFGINK